MQWAVYFTRKAEKQAKKLKPRILAALDLFVTEMQIVGPSAGHKWPNFSKLNSKLWHCHLVKGKPTYVCCWEIIDKKIKVIEVYYVGTHENAPY